MGEMIRSVLNSRNVKIFYSEDMKSCKIVYLSDAELEALYGDGQ